MSIMIVDGEDTRLRCDEDMLMEYRGGALHNRTPLRLIDRLVLSGKVRFETNLLQHFADRGIPVVMLSGRGGQRLACSSGGGDRDAGIRMAQLQHMSNPVWCDAWATRTVRMKVRGQHAFLRRMLEIRPDCRGSSLKTMGSLEQILKTLRAAPVASASARGYEGLAAADYFRALTPLFPPALGFSGRNRRPPKDPVNACLSLGYTLLHAEALRACHIEGLDPMAGFYHRLAYGRESLACDLIEALRPRIDAWVWRLFRDRTLDPKNFTNENGACLLGKAGRTHFYASWREHADPWRRHLRREAAALVRVLLRRIGPLPVVSQNEED